MKRWSLFIASFVVMLGTGLFAQTVEFLPEIDTYVKINSNSRFAFQAKQTREGGEPTQGEIGPSMDFYWRPFKGFDEHPDETKTRFMLLSFGYRYMPTKNEPATNRVLMVLTPQFPLFHSKFVLSDRNRGELNFSNGDLTWRYRNRLRIEREITIGSYHPRPYASVEPFYDSKYQKWSSTEIEVGSEFPIQRHAAMELYYQHENNTGKAPNQQVNGIGLILNLYF